MSEATAPLSYARPLERRRYARQPIAVPVDIVVLRSGIPSTIPARSVDISEGGLAAIIAGELRPGESVGLELNLPLGMEPVRARALVCHQQQLCCRLQFMAMSAESRAGLRTWIKLNDTKSFRPATAEVVAGSPRNEHSPGPKPEAPTGDLRRRRQSRKAKWMALSPLLLVLSVVVWWWSWQNGWISADLSTSAEASSHGPVVTVPSSVMEHSLLHRVDPTYPDEAVKEKMEGLVVVGATIGPDGAVKQVHPLSGPELLAQAAVNAVKWWRFTPYEVDGHPAEVQTTIEVDFRLHD